MDAQRDTHDLSLAAASRQDRHNRVVPGAIND